MSLDNKTRRKYRGIGHHLDPVVIVSNGLTENVNNEINRALSDHELIKVRINTSDRESRKALIEEICATQKAEPVQVIGNIALIFRAAVEPKPHLSNLVRYRQFLV